MPISFSTGTGEKYLTRQWYKHQAIYNHILLYGSAVVLKARPLASRHLEANFYGLASKVQALVWALKPALTFSWHHLQMQEK